MAWVEVQAKLLTAIIASVLPADLLALRDPLYAGFLTHAALFAEKSARINLEEVIAPTALFTIFERTFAHHPSFLPTLGRFYEATPDRLKHTVPNLVALLTPALPFITKLSKQPFPIGLLWGIWACPPSAF